MKRLLDASDREILLRIVLYSVVVVWVFMVFAIAVRLFREVNGW